MITQLLNTVKEESNVNLTQSAKHRPNFTCESETKANNISDMITILKVKEREASISSPMKVQ